MPQKTPAKPKNNDETQAGISWKTVITILGSIATLVSAVASGLDFIQYLQGDRQLFLWLGVGVFSLVWGIILWLLFRQRNIYAYLWLAVTLVASVSIVAMREPNDPAEPIKPDLAESGNGSGMDGTISPSKTPAFIPTEWVDPKGMKMVLIPESYFIMGTLLKDALAECGKLNYPNCTEVFYGDAVPPHQIYLYAYYIDKFETTNKDYLACVNEGVCPTPIQTEMNGAEYFGAPAFDDYPVVHVTWDMAKTYCEWRGGRLPTEAEWEKAARGVNGQTYPWGNTFDCKKGNFDDETTLDASVVVGGPHCDGYDTTSPVGAFPDGRSPFGAYDMAGNVWEWVSSLYTSYPYDAADGREDTSLEGIHVIRGGSWYWFDYMPVTYHRVWLDHQSADGHIGFRCAANVETINK